MRSSAQSGLKIFKTALLLFCAGVLLCEASVRLYERIRYGAPWGVYERERTLWMQDRIGEIGRPHARFKDVTLNSLGLRGPELRLGTTRLVCIGASETFGLYESPGKEYPRQLEQLLNSAYSSKKYDVLNLSYAGATLDGFVSRVPAFVEQVHPVMAIIYPSPEAYIGAPPQFQSKAPPGCTFLQMRLAPYARALFHARAPVGVKRMAYSTWSWLQQHGRAPLASIPSDWILRFRSDLQHLVGRLRQGSVEPVLLTHATPFGGQLDEYDQVLLIQWRRFYPEVSESALLEMEARSNESIRRLAQEERVELVDIGERLRGCRDCFADFVHFTDRGAAKVAVLLDASIGSKLRRHGTAANRQGIIRQP